MLLESKTITFKVCRRLWQYLGIETVEIKTRETMKEMCVRLKLFFCLQLEKDFEEMFVVVNIIQRKCSSYSIPITAQANKKALGPSDITLARLAQAFAPITAALIIGHRIQGKLTSKLFGLSNLPVLMSHSIFPGLLRSSDLDLINVAKVLNVEMTLLLCTPKERRRMESQSMEELLEKSSQFVMAAVNGSLIIDNSQAQHTQKSRDSERR